ncbi:beta-galactosidase [Bifidobacterium amazonense]|uniref:Beta-galactosidase n=1 Tax=Bifidobacterium amazonense TaxID=2809027 RepID=A0ABS9VTY8_9BIFI|nr:beta-galactosidase [Bifidobacterium amazonense]MCH9275270.1 beta-galactosidase [Bifidobacterium amazonense]
MTGGSSADSAFAADKNGNVRFDDDRLLIDGVPRVLMCASLFPFRVPRSQWRHRLQAVKRLGYHAIDVYVPWNYHETAPGTWDFTGQRDIDAFLRLAHETGLYAMVRPGPYICSEWDGGAIPAWVATDPSVDVRQNDPGFLDAVRGWYDRILPIIARRQYGQGGPVIMVQADNELDFFSCRDPQGYIGALVGMMRKAGIGVPIVACAGQGDYERAGAGPSGAAPAVNIYQDDDGVGWELQTRYYRNASRGYGAPLIVTETNRRHRTLRRLVGSGARFVGPFLQVSGWDFDYGTSVNNWGRLETFMTHDYDFGGVIDPAGHERPDAADARRLCAIIDALGERLATAEPVDDDPIGMDASSDAGGGEDGRSGGERESGVRNADGSLLDPDGQRIAVGELALGGGGRLVTITNVSDASATLTLADGMTLSVPAGAGLMAVRDLPLNGRLTLAATDGELVRLDEHRATLSAPTMIPGTVHAVLRIGATNGAEAAVSCRTSGDVVADMLNGRVDITGTEGEVRLVRADGTEYDVVVTQPERAVPDTATSSGGDESASRGSGSCGTVALTDVETGIAQPEWVVACDGSDEPRSLESIGVYRGTARYRAATGGETALGVVLRNAADIVDVTYGTARTDRLATGQSATWIRFPEPASGDEITVHTGIWGHCNFDDSRLDALRLSAGRGMDGLLLVQREIDCGDGWIISDGRTDANDGPVRFGPAVGRRPGPRSSFASRSTTVWPNRLTYTTALHVGSVDAAMRFDGIRCRCDVLVDGRSAGSATPWQPTVWLGPIRNGSVLSVVVWKTWGEDAGRPMLLVGRNVHGWTVASWDYDQLEQADRQCRYTTSTLPINVPDGGGVWVRVASDRLKAACDGMNTVVRFRGSHLQLTAVTDRYRLGRVVLGGLPGTGFAGGHGDYLLVPEDAGDLRVYCEATAASGGRLDGVTLGGPIDLRRR